MAFGFYKVVKYYYWPGFHEPGSGLACGVNKGVWEKLSDSDKEIFKAACLAENNYMLSEFFANNGAALDTLINEHGVQLREFPEEVFNAIGKTSDEVVRASVTDDIGKRILESYLKARKNIGGWTRISDSAYTNARDKVLGA